MFIDKADAYKHFVPTALLRDALLDLIHGVDCSMTIQQQVRDELRAAIKALFDMDLAEFTSEIPPRTELGDLAFPVAFELAKRLKAATGQKQNPREVASRLAEKLRAVEGVARTEVAGAGYINVYFDRASYLLNVAQGSAAPAPQLGGKIIVEHTAVNPNKAAHIGHLRNAVLGDTTVRLLRAAGETVEVQNYIDNTGVQVADVVVGFRHIEQKSLEEIKAIEGKFDFYCWNLYARVGQFYEEDKSRLALRAETLHAIESGEGEVYEMADYVATRIVHHHLDTFLRVGIKYDVLPRESDVLHLHLWNRAFELLKTRGAIEQVGEGKLAGCWVMRAADDGHPADEEESEHEADKVIVRSNGTVTYTGKDIAFHLWKLGQLDLDFYYKPFRTYPDGHTVWVTTSNERDDYPMHPKFGNGAAYFNVIDIGQSYPQHYVKLGVMAVDHDERVERSAHLAYEKVTLSPAAAEQLGQQLSEEDRKRGAVSMSGRKGLGVKADDLIDQLQASAFAEVESRHPELDESEQQATAHKIAVGALRYFLLKYLRNSIIAFDFKEALSFDGETGPYIQYSVVRANSIFRKLTDAGITPGAAALREVARERLNELLGNEAGDDLWSLCYLASRLDEVIGGAVGTLEPAIVAKWTFQLAQRFNLFYHHYHILSETDADRRALLVAITAIVRERLIAALDVLGIEAPERM
ncbi:MAG TPA: arginine--tRNA ligase [Blastocatellia bacterium]|nr:arginine--tRNA ligase [Blastocatellia bacterium]